MSTRTAAAALVKPAATAASNYQIFDCVIIANL
jgi:hypothetical protein